MKLNYYISELRHSLPSDYEHLDTRLLIRLINQFRAQYIKNEYNKNKTIDPALAQEINFEVKPADISTVSFISTTDRILRSVRNIPEPIKISHRDLVLTIRNAKLLDRNYNYVTKDEAIYSGNGKMNTKDIYGFIYNDDFYVKLKKENPKVALLTIISMNAIWENPLDCIYFQTNDYTDPLDYEYPITDTIWGYIKANILRDGLQIISAEINEEKTQG